MTTPNIEELITYLRGFFIDEKVTAVKANQIADALQSQAERIKALAALEFDGFSPEDLTHRKYVKAAIESLKAALAQQGEQAIGYVRTINGEPTPDDNNTIFSYGANPYRDVMGNEEWVAVYTAAPAPAPQPAQGELEK